MRDMVPFRRRNGLSPMDLFKDFFGRDLMDDFFGSSMLPVGMTGGFRADIRETDKEYVVEAELAGYDKDEIEIDLVDDRLTISAKKDENIEEENGQYIRRERRIGQASRCFMVSGIENDKVNAEYVDGLLRVILPKEEESKPRNKKIDIN